MKEAVSCIIFDNQRSRIILIKRRDIPVWVLPGGGIDPGESPEEAAVREAKEETGLDVQIKRKVAKYFPANRLTRITHFFECEICGGRATTGAETKAIDFYELNNLPKRLAPFYHHWIADAQKNRSELIEATIKETSYWMMIKLLIKHPLTVIRFLLTRVGIHVNY